jgi:hypothetical protein
MNATWDTRFGSPFHDVFSETTFYQVVLFDSFTHYACILPAAGGAGGQLSRYSDSLRAGWVGDRIPVRGEIFCTCPGRPWGPPSLRHNGYRVFPGGKAAGAWR